MPTTATREMGGGEVDDAAIGGHQQMKFIVGWLQFKPGTRDAFITRVQPLIEKIRAEDGNVFFEFNPRVGQPDTAVLTECFVDDAAHRAHKLLPHMTEMFAALGEVVTAGDVKVHFADELFDDD